MHTKNNEPKQLAKAIPLSAGMYKILADETYNDFKETVNGTLIDPLQ